MKKDKQAFDAIFEYAKLYISYLSNSVNPIVFEYVMVGHIFRNHKTLLESSKEEDKVNEGVIEEDIELPVENKTHGNILIDRTCKKWKGLTNSLHMKDLQNLLKSIFKICNYSERCGMVTSS